jgi:hypothetical protein
MDDVDIDFNEKAVKTKNGETTKANNKGKRNTKKCIFYINIFKIYFNTNQSRNR